MKKLAFLALASLALIATSAKPSEAHWWPYCGCWHHHWHPAPVVFRDYGPGYVWWDVPYYFYSPYRVVDHVLVHESIEIGPTNVWP